VELDGIDPTPLAGASEHGGEALLTSTTPAKCPSCRAGLAVTVSAGGVDTALTYEPTHPRWSARNLSWANGSSFAVASLECLGVTMVHRSGMEVTLGPDLARCEHHGFDPSGERLLVDFTPFPRGPGSPRDLAVWSPRSGEVLRLAKAEAGFEPPMLSRSRSAHDAIGWHRSGEHVIAMKSDVLSQSALTVWSVRERRARTETLPTIERGRAWLEPGGDRMLWEEQTGARCRLVLVRIDPTSRSLVPSPLGILVRERPTDVSDVVWEPDGSLLVAYVQNERGLLDYDRMPYGLLRLDPEMRVRTDRFPLEPELCPMKPAPCTLFRRPGGDVVFVTDRAYTLDGADLRPSGVLPTNVIGGEAFRFAPTGEVVAIAGPSDIHLASLSTSERTSLRTALG
jgi:hypothetical protein